LILFALPGSALLAAGREAGLRVAAEAFGDRAYQSDGSLAPRSAPGSVIHDAASVVARTLRLLSAQVVDSVDGTPVSLVADTICLHGDTQGADDLAAKLRAGLEAAGVEVRAIGAG
jgi:UPF0271 protein